MMVASAQRLAVAPAEGPEHTPAQQRASFLQQLRLRLGLQVCVAVALGTGAMAGIAIQERQWLSLSFVLVGLVLTAGAGVQMRRTRSVEGPTTLLLVWSFACVIFVSWTERGLAVSISPWPPLLVLYALFMLGPRHGRVFVAVAVLQAGVSLLLHRMGWNLPLSLVSSWDSGEAVLSAALAIGLVGMLGYVYERSQQRTLAGVEDALIASEHNERELDAMFDSAMAAICSIDPACRLVLHNRAFASMASARALAPRAGDALADVLGPAQWARWRPPIERALAGAGPALLEEPPEHEAAAYRETMIQPILVHGQVAAVTVFCRDITARKRAEAETRQLRQELVRVSRQAGMAAVASEVLHNAGNVLNHTGVSVAMLDQGVQALRTAPLSRAVALMEEHAGALDRFLRDDPGGRHLLELLGGLAQHFTQQQQEIEREIGSLQKSVEHLTRVIHAQQSHARSLGVLERVSVTELLDAVLHLQAPSWAELGIAVEREIAELPPLCIDRHRVMEILVNLVSNARQSLRESGELDPWLRIRAEPAGPERVRIHVEDNGRGISAEHREQLFRLGFTTRHDGSGIGLHSCANLVQQLGGSLWFRSDGPGRGAVFTVELPIAPPPAAPGGSRPDTLSPEE
jgi:two-component system sensor kinase FixL